MDLTLELPRSVLLALWLAEDPVDRALVVDAVQSDDEPHTVRQRSSSDGSPDETDEPLSALLDACDATPRDVAAVLPVPGDPGATPASVSSAATDAGEALLVRTPQRCLVAVPVVERFGSALEPGHLVTWEVGDVPDWRPAVHAQTGSLQDAERELRQGLLQATEALVRLDVARWRPDLAGTVAALRDVEVPAWRLPAGLDGRRARVLTSAARLRAIVALATQDDGAAVNLWQADQRSTALREVDRIARRAMAAAASRLTG
ncbi:hypothetical protein [Cellulomonas fengjieae]|uniref:hypothetical protein n=1 Tax=Cellulomonas fengjieae TaxID=2819978 RepID=UPI001AAF7395|nr:hypothetical protein [Cellulomonas fengjieae]MBO3102998.1 hypothetical protein [Cellulomonas fengjieae]